ncbi:MAG: CofH family radical SAM protein [Candidatus Sumerlaeia bacterium]
MSEAFSKKIEPLRRTIEAGHRVSRQDALWLVEQADLVELGRLAGLRRERLYGRRTTYIRNLHINISNVCEGRCDFCAYRKDADDFGAFTMSPHEVWEYAETHAPEDVREFHIVGGLNPELIVADYVEILQGLKQRFPGVFLKAFTAVEIDYMARRAKKAPRHVLAELKDAGLQALTGGGAEIFAERVRKQICPDKISGEEYLSIHRQAHEMGITSTATMLFGHLEKREDRVDHLCRLRRLQDQTHGFTAFVPLVFHPENTNLDYLEKASARAILETIALSRLVLDNIPHIKAYWVSLGKKISRLALEWGADDLDGTVVRERIHDSAGAESGDGMSAEEMRAMIRDGGWEPVERGADWKNLPEANSARPVRSADKTEELLDAVAAGEHRLSAEEADWLLVRAPLLDLARAAHRMRMRLHPEPLVTYNVDRNINTTNACVSLCEFCAFAVKHKSADAWRIGREEIARKIEELYKVYDEIAGKKADGPRNPKPQILLQGGLDPQLRLDYYTDLFQWMRERWPDLHIHALSPPEIHFLAEQAGISWGQCIKRLHAAGLDSIPGGGAEILADRVRKRVSPHKCHVADWIGIMRVAHHEGLRTTATMVIGLGEFPRERIEHLERIRALQDETQGFTAFIPWTFQPMHTPIHEKIATTSHQPSAETGNRHSVRIPVMEQYGASCVAYLRILAVARLFLDNVENLQASWLTQGSAIAQMALLFGANDMGSTMLEENVVAAAGRRFRLGPDQIEALILDLDLEPARRDFFYSIKV